MAISWPMPRSHDSADEPRRASRRQPSITSSPISRKQASSRSYQLSRAASITTVAGSGRSSWNAARLISSMKKKSYSRQREVQVGGNTSSVPEADSSIQPGGSCSCASMPVSTVFQPLAGSVVAGKALAGVSRRDSVVSASFCRRISTPGSPGGTWVDVPGVLRPVFPVPVFAGAASFAAASRVFAA